MKSASLAALALLVSTPQLVFGRHPSSNKMRHVVRSPLGYDSGVQQCQCSGYTASSIVNVSRSTSSSSVSAGAYGSRATVSSLTVSSSSSMTTPGGSVPSIPPSPSPPPPASSTLNSSIPSAAPPLVAGPYRVVVAPKMGDLRMVPFNIDVPLGQNVTFIWGAGPHTVTQSSPLEICTASQAEGAFTSGGVRAAGFELPVAVTTNKTVTYFCSVPGHCEKGMFGLVNGLTVAVPEGSFGQLMPEMAANDPGLAQLWNETKATCDDSPAAWAWGNNLSTSQVPDWALPSAMRSILLTRQTLATTAARRPDNAESTAQPSSTTSTTTSAPSDASQSSSSSPSSLSSTATRGSGDPGRLRVVVVVVVVSLLASFVVGVTPLAGSI
ncbi:hypothetical protein JCM11491_003870 [Sporobolomyces phaffii]